MNQIKTTACILTKNEKNTISNIITKSWQHCDELIVVDGHSTDGTKELAERLGAKVFLDDGLGKGCGIRKGIKESEGDIIVFIDADGSHDPGDIPKLVAPIKENKADMVIASRMRGGSDELHGDISKFMRVTGSHIITISINYYFKVNLTDSQNGFRAIRTSCVKQLNLKENITTTEQEMLIKALHKKFRITEIASHEYKREYGESVIKLEKVFFRYFYTWIRYLFFK